MIHYSPVVFTNDPQVADAALTRGWRVVSRHPHNERVIQLTGNPVLCGIPQETFSLEAGSLDGESAAVWKYVLNWLELHVPRPLLVVAPNDWLTELALWAAATRSWPIGVLIAEQPTLTPQAISLMTAADGFFFIGSDVETEFTRGWSAHVERLPETCLVRLPSSPPPGETRAAEGVTRVLLIGYYGGPSPTVGVQRTNYWFEQLELLSEGRVTVDYAVATPWPDAPEHVHRIPDLWLFNTLQEPTPEPTLHNAIREENAQRAYPYRRQAAGYWSWALEQYFDARDDEFDVVILSGNPYPYFDFRLP